MSISKKKAEFNDFRFNGLDWKEQSNKYLTMNRVSEDRCVVKVGESHIFKTRFGYGLRLDSKHVVWLKDWQVSDNYYGTEVLLTKDYFNVKEVEENFDFDENEDALTYEHWLNAAEQQSKVDEDGSKLNPVHWEK